MELKLDVETAENTRSICARVLEIEPRSLDSRLPKWDIPVHHSGTSSAKNKWTLFV
jgi:hypothetical protein